MSFSNMLEFIKKEIRQLVRDRRTLALVILEPIIVILIFSLSIHHGVSNIDTLILTQELENLDITRVIEETGIFHIIRHVSSTNEIYDAIKDGEGRVGIISCSSGSASLNLTFIYDSTNVVINGAVKEGVAEIGKKLSPILSIHVLLEPFFGEYTYFESYSAGIFCLALFWVCISTVSLSITTEKTSGTIDRLLVTPYSKTEMIIGKLIGNIIVAVSAGITSALVLFWILGVDVKGSIPIIVSVSILVGIISLGHGLLISAFVRTEREALQVDSYLGLVYLFLSNMFWPVEMMHWSMAYMRLGCFLTYAVNALNGIMLKGYSVLEVGQDIIILGIFGLLFLLLGILAFRRGIEKT